jgi:COP9 signalosome complex subunit 7
LSPFLLPLFLPLSFFYVDRPIQTLPYSLLLSALDITTVRELEDFLIEGMFDGLLKGKMDQQRACLMIDDSIGRDVNPEELVTLTSAMSEWWVVSPSPVHLFFSFRCQTY